MPGRLNAEESGSLFSLKLRIPLSLSSPFTHYNNFRNLSYSTQWRKCLALPLKHAQLSGKLTRLVISTLSFSSYASAAKDRLTGLISHLTAQGKDALTSQNPDDVVICAAVRTPITRAKKGGLKDTCPEDLLVAVFKGVVERSGIDKNLVEEIQVGNVLPPGGGATVARMAQLAGKGGSLTSTSTF